MEGRPSRSLVIALLGVLLPGTGSCPSAGTDVLVSVADIDGAPVGAFTLQIDERGSRTWTTVVDVEGQSTFLYHMQEPGATLLVFVEGTEFHTGVAVVPPGEQSAPYGPPLGVSVTLVPEATCLAPPPECVADDGALPVVAEGEQSIVVGVDDWVSASELPSILDPYCLAVQADPSVDAFSMWTDLVEGDVDQTVALLEASGIVSWADPRGYDGDHLGTTILIQFLLGTTINQAQDLIEGTPGLEWLETVLSPTWGVVAVPSSDTGAWICTLEQDPNIVYAHVDAPLPASQRLGTAFR